MSHSFFKGILLLFIIWIPAQNIKSQNLSPADSELRIISYNIRYAGNSETEGINSWDNRKKFISSQIKSFDADIIGIQEALINQLDDLSSLLPAYRWAGKGRDDGNLKGEFCPVMYKEALYEMLSSDTFWLSETPDIPSKGWDAALNRICTYVKMKVKKNGVIFYFFNTHFDHIGENARSFSAGLLVKKINELSEGKPVILTGDFNDPSGREFYKTITNQLKDAKDISASGHKGADFSYNGFNSDAEEGDRIDYIFVSRSLKVLEHKIIAEKFNGQYPSDHFPVVSVVRFK